MRILVVGSAGNMGKRYCAILRWLHHEVLTWDKTTDRPGSLNRAIANADRVIIATPTPTHIEVATRCAKLGKSFLCEKPVDKDPQKIAELESLCRRNGADGRMVCNWSFSFCVPPMVNRHHRPILSRAHGVSYNCFRTGNDGLGWDCIQLAYLARDSRSLFLGNDCPYLHATINGRRVTTDNIERSYIAMIETWLTNPSLLWNLQDAKSATHAVLEYIEQGREWKK
jgi:hypothetical protein